MKRIVFLSALILAIGLYNCARKQLPICGLRSLESKPNIDGKIVQLERIAIADTTIASVSGEILGRDSLEAGVVIDTLIRALVIFTDKITDKTYGTQADLHGKYQCYLPASSYDIKVQCIAYNTLIVRNVSIGTGDIVKFNAILGESGMRDQNTIFEMQTDKTIKRIVQPMDTNK